MGRPPKVYEPTHIKGKRLTRKEKQEALALHVAGLSYRQIAERMNANFKTVQKIVQSADPLMKVGAGERAAKLVGVPAEVMRQEQKTLLMRRFHGLTDEACDFLEEAIRTRDASKFRDVAAALEKVDKMSGNTVGEAQASAAAPPITIDLGSLIDRILGRVEGARA